MEFCVSGQNFERKAPFVRTPLKKKGGRGGVGLISKDEPIMAGFHTGFWVGGENRMVAG